MGCFHVVCDFRSINDGGQTLVRPFSASPRRSRLHTIDPGLEDHLSQLAGRRDALADRIAIGLRFIGHCSEIADKKSRRPPCGRIVARGEHRGADKQDGQGWDGWHWYRMRWAAQKILKKTD